MSAKGPTIIGAISMAIVCAGPLQATAQTMTPDECVNRLPYLHSRPTIDTTPIKIRVGSVIYEIPRNYVKTAVDLMPTLWITYPQFQPPKPETRCSSKNQLPVGPSECVILELTIHGNIDGLLGRPLSNEVLFRRMTKIDPPPLTSFEGPSGLRMYSSGGGGSRGIMEIYKTDDYKTLFYCASSPPHANIDNAVCVDEITLVDGNAVHVFFSHYLVPYAPEFDNRVRALIASFKRERASR